MFLANAGLIEGVRGRSVKSNCGELRELAGNDSRRCWRIADRN
jgi:hypothetical protein